MADRAVVMVAEAGEVEEGDMKLIIKVGGEAAAAGVETVKMVLMERTVLKAMQGFTGERMMEAWAVMAVSMEFLGKADGEGLREAQLHGMEGLVIRTSMQLMVLRGMMGWEARTEVREN